MSVSSRKDVAGKRGGYTSLNLNQSYKGARPEGGRSYGKSHGLQSLGKVAATSRRIPGPASLPSLRSENAGNDPTVNLVPSGGGGWKNTKDNKENRVNNEPQSDKKEPKLRPQTPPSRQQRQQQKHPPSPGRKFKAEFPSLEEQEAMSKRELEELERRQREEGRDGDRERSPERNSRPPGDRERGWRDPPSGPPHGHHGPPPPNMGPYPPPRGPYPLPPYHPPYMMHPPPRPGMAPYGGPPMAGPGGRYPPPPHVHYRPPYLHNYPPPNPYEMPDPYKMPPRKGDKGEEVSRPPTVKADDLKSMDMPDDEEGGWAGHHEEVDYTKEVVFEDSSDDEPSGRSPSGEEKRGRSSLRKKEKETTGADKDSESGPGKRLDRADPEADPEYPREDREREWDFDRNPRHSEGGREGRAPPGGGGPRPVHPSYPPYPSYPYQYDPYRYPQQPYPTHPGHYPMHPQSNYPPHSHSQRYGHQRGVKRGPPDREWDRDKDDSAWRHDFHPWSQHEEHRPKRRWSGGEEWTEDRERPRILAKPDEKKDSRKTSEARDEPFTCEIEKGKEKSSSAKRSDSASPDAQEGSGKPRVTFASDAREKSQSPLPEDLPSPAARPAMRSAHPKKIMLRKLGGAESPTAEKQDLHGAAAKGTKKERPKDLKNLKEGDPSDALDTDSPNTPDNEAKIKQTAWSVRERGPITSPKTLYEPEGKKSAAKFHKYQRERVSGASAGKGESGSRGASSPSTPSPDVKVLPKEEEKGGQKGEDEKEATERVQAVSPTPVEQESSQAPESAVEQKKGAPERPPRPPRQDSGRQPHERERNTQDSREPRDRGRHRRVEGREKGGPRRQDTREEPQEPAKDRDKDGRGRDERERQAHGRKGGDHDSGREKGAGFPTREFSRHGRSERGRGEHPGRKQDAPQGGAAHERREGDRRRDHPNEPRPAAHKDQNQPDRTGRGEAHPSRPEPPRGDGRPRREERRPREKQERPFRSAGHEHQDGKLVEPTPSSANTALEQQSGASKTHSGEAGKPAVGETSARVADKAERFEPHGPAASGPDARSVPEHAEHKEHQKPRDGRRDDRRPERAADRQRGGQRGAAGDKERERGGRNPQRDRERGERDRDRGRPSGEDRERGERERGGKAPAEKDRGEREGRSGKHPPKDRSTEHPERGGRSNTDRRPARDSRKAADQGGERGERRERFGGRQRERGPPGGRRMPAKGQERAPEKTQRTDHAAEPPKGTAKPGPVYDGLEEIESGSDWEDDVETIDATGTVKVPVKGDEELQTEPSNEKQPLKAGEGKTGSVPQSGKPLQAERSQRPESGREPRRGVGRGRGRSEDPKRGREPGRPGSYSSQRRQGGSRDNSRGLEKQTATESGGLSATSSRESADGKSKDRATHSEKKSRDATPQPSHKVADFDKYDLNSHKVAIVDDIGSEGADPGRFSPSVQGEFVEVTSKKAQKEKLKKEKEEQRRLDEEKRKLEDERLRRTKKLSSSRPAASQDKNLPSPPKPAHAWGSNGTKSETEIGSVWAGADWLMMPTSAAPGSQLKSPGLGGDSRWPSGSAAAANSIGVIGDSLQLKQLLPAGNALNPFSAATDNHTYSLFGSVNPIASPFLGAPALPTGSGGSMLEAAVESTVPKLSQEALAGVSSEEPLDLVEAPFLLSDEDQVGDETKDKGKESPEFQKVERNRRGGKNLPPRFQSSKGQSSGPGRGRGTGGKGGDEPSDRFYTHPKGRGGDRDRGPRSGGERRHPQGSKPAPRQSSTAGAAKGSEKTSSDRFYVPPRTRGERDQPRGQKSSGDRRQPPAPKPSSKPQQPTDSVKQSKVVNTGHGRPKASSPVPSLEVGPLIDPSPLPLEEGSAAEQRQLRAGRSAAAAVAAARRQGEDQGKSKTGDLFPKTHAQVVVTGLGPRTQSQGQHGNQSDGSSPDCGDLAVSESGVSQSVHAKEGQLEAVAVPLEREGELVGSLRKHDDFPPRNSRPNGSPNLTSSSRNSQRSRPTSSSSASTKTISYAQALKADLSTADTGSKLSSRSQTPSDSSAFQSISRSQGSSRASTPAGFRRPVQAQLPESRSLSREHTSRSQSAQSNTNDIVAASAVGGAGNESVEALRSGRTSREDAASVSRLTPDPAATTTTARAPAHSKATVVSERALLEHSGSGEKSAEHRAKNASTSSQAEESENRSLASSEVKNGDAVSAADRPTEIQRLERKVTPVSSSEPSRIETTVPTTSHALVEVENPVSKPPPGLSLNRAHCQSEAQMSGQSAVVLPVDREPAAPPQSTSQVPSNPFQASPMQQPLEPSNPPTKHAMPTAPSRPDALREVYGPELRTSTQQHPGFEKPPSRPPQPTQESPYEQRTAVLSNQAAMLPRQQGIGQPAKLIQEYAVNRHVQLQHEALHPGAKQLHHHHQQQQQALQHHQKPGLVPPRSLRPADLETDPRPEKFSNVPAPGSAVIRPSPSSPTATAVRSSPIMAGTPTSLQTRNPTRVASSAFTPYSRVPVHVPTTRPSSAGHLQGHTLQYSSASLQAQVERHTSQGSPKRRISQTAAQPSMEREDREQSAESSKSSLSVAATPFVPSNGAASASVPVSISPPVKRRSTGSGRTVMEFPVPPMHAGFERPQLHMPIPQHALLHHQQQQLRASQPAVTAVSPNTAALVGHHQRLAAAPNAPAMQTLLLVRPQLAHHQLQQAALNNPSLPHTLAPRQPPQHVRTTEAIQVISPQNPAHSKVLRSQHEMSVLAGAVMVQRQHEGRVSRKLSHPHGGDQLGRSPAIQARMPPPNVIQPPVLYPHHNQRIPVGSAPSGSERQGYVPGQTVANYNLSLQLAQQKTASANVQKRPLLPTPPGLPSFLRTVAPVPNQTWPTALLQHMHVGAVRPPYPRAQEQQQQPKSSQY